MDIEIKEHSNRIEKGNNRIQIADCCALRNAHFKGDLERSVIGFQYQLFRFRQQLEEIRREFEENRRLVSQLRDEEDRFGIVALSEREEADKAREQAKEAELKAQHTRKEIEQLLGRYGNDGAGLKEMLEPEMEKPAFARSSAPGQARKRKRTRKSKIWSQNMIDNGCLMLGLTQEEADLFQSSV